MNILIFISKIVVIFNLEKVGNTDRTLPWVRLKSIILVHVTMPLPKRLVFVDPHSC